jgi:prevent-host-death family protein
MTSREFNQYTGRAKAAADHGPVFITDRGERRYVLLSSAEFDKLTGGTRNIVDALADTRPEGDFDFEFERTSGSFRPTDFAEE